MWLPDKQLVVIRADGPGQVQQVLAGGGGDVSWDALAPDEPDDLLERV